MLCFELAQLSFSIGAININNKDLGFLAGGDSNIASTGGPPRPPGRGVGGYLVPSRPDKKRKKDRGNLFLFVD